MDDASGVAAEIEVAHQLKRAGSRLKRSVLFLCVTGEEKGLLGSRYFAEHPTVPIHQIVADINLDMFLPLYPLHTLEVQGLNESTLGQDLARVAAAHSIDVQPDQHPGHNLFIRSDQYNFVLKGVPAIFFGFGFGQGTKEQKIQQQWFATRYHSPSDDTSQPVDLAAAGQFNEIVATLLERVANAPQRPAWLPSSFFKRFAAKT
jgi:Zn-dependent M28 family amino/carboxypeptidase